MADRSYRVQKSEGEWREELDEEQYHVLREKGTERAFTGKYWDHKGSGDYACAGCGQALFSSQSKYDSGCGWPSFYAPADPAGIDEADDRSFGMVRIEVLCSNCGGHLGHRFPDGPEPTGQRYCINSASLTFSDSAPQGSDESD
ncbi:MAG TPA: peptide-methionine (R)-S-oxide reductase [Deltaproteobacteria bacterium]|nr:peptide-methionine (R)-S-oxide reductase [Deltaproteobacteria bacterium]HCP48556.1 peptide-methionine (R)-S-oxide reductase [Deltaproteobacteria bacterium]|tara:strand:+ start:374 stop:805 length:432 start_codon:yes stop_codon:yes gene_type:complete